VILRRYQRRQRRIYPWEGIVSHHQHDDEAVKDRAIVRDEDGGLYVETTYHDGRPAEREPYIAPEDAA
jgi:hypothetical protein